MTIHDLIVFCMFVGLGTPVPLLALLGTMNQRKQLRYERARYALMKRMANGRSWR